MNNPGSGSQRTRWAPAWIIVLATVLVYLGVLYVDDHGAAFSKTVYGPWKSEGDFTRLLPPKDPMMDLGRQVYLTSCAPCHQNSGLGSPGQFPPLVGSEWVTAEGANRLVRIVLNGAQGPMTVKGAQYSNVMVPWRDALDDKKIAAVLTFIRGNADWGHSAAAVKPDQVAKIRKATAEKGAGWTQEELLAVPLKD